MPTMTVKLPKVLATRLDGVVRRRSTTRSTFVRDAVERALAEGATGQVGGMCLDLAADLEGIVRGGARDLSSNPRHLQGFGR